MHISSLTSLYYFLNSLFLLNVKPIDFVTMETPKSPFRDALHNALTSNVSLSIPSFCPWLVGLVSLTFGAYRLDPIPFYRNPGG